MFETSTARMNIKYRRVAVLVKKNTWQTENKNNLNGVNFNVAYSLSSL